MFVERWTIDQLFDDRVAVARAIYRHELGVGDAEGVAAAAPRLETEGFNVEDWEPEFISVLDRARLEEELSVELSGPNAVAGKVGETEDPRALFEGQVLWMVSPERLRRDPDGRSTGAEGTEWPLSSVPVHDVSLPERFLHSQPGRARRSAWIESGHLIDVSPRHELR